MNKVDSSHCMIFRPCLENPKEGQDGAGENHIVLPCSSAVSSLARAMGYTQAYGISRPKPGTLPALFVSFVLSVPFVAFIAFILFVLFVLFVADMPLSPFFQGIFHVSSARMNFIFNPAP